MNDKFYPVSLSIPHVSFTLPCAAPLNSGCGLSPMLDISGDSAHLSIAAPFADTLKGLFNNEASVNLTTKLINKEKHAPTTLKELLSEDIFTSVLSVDVAMKLGIPLGTTGGSFARRVFIQEYAKYTDILEGEGNVRWGVAIRWINDIKILKAEANISSLPILSASAQLGYIEASTKFQVVGIASKTITPLLPNNIELNVESYVRFKDAMDQIKKHIWDEDVVVSPTILAIYSGLNISEDDQYHRAITTAWALQMIAKGVALRSSLESDPFACSTSYETIKDVYLDLAETTALDALPSNSAKDKASELLKGIRIKS